MVSKINNNEENNDEDVENTLIQKCKQMKDFPLKNFDMGPVIGEGEFGQVQKSTLIDGTARWDVALKTVKDKGSIVSIALISCLSH